MDNITEIIPDDMPQWMKDAMDEGQLFNKVCERIKEAENRNEKFFHAGFHRGIGSDISAIGKIDELFAIELFIIDKQEGGDG